MTACTLCRFVGILRMGTAIQLVCVDVLCHPADSLPGTQPGNRIWAQEPVEYLAHLACCAVGLHGGAGPMFVGVLPGLRSTLEAARQGLIMGAATLSVTEVTGGHGARLCMMCWCYDWIWS